MSKKMLFAYTGPLKDIDLAIHKRHNKINVPYVFYKQVIGTRPIKKLRGGMIEMDIEDVWCYSIERQDKIDLDDPNVIMIASNFNLEALKIFAEGYKRMKEI